MKNATDARRAARVMNGSRLHPEKSWLAKLPLALLRRRRDSVPNGSGVPELTSAQQSGRTCKPARSRSTAVRFLADRAPGISCKVTARVPNKRRSAVDRLRCTEGTLWQLAADWSGSSQYTLHFQDLLVVRFHYTRCNGSIKLHLYSTILFFLN